MSYASFILRFEHGEGGRFTFSVESPAGEATGSCDLTRFLDRALLLRAVSGLVAAPRLRPPADLEQLGRELFEEIFQGEVRDLLHASRATARSSQQRGLRLQVELDPRRGELARLLDVPWELLVDPADGKFFALSPTTPIVRYLALPKPPGSIALPRPLRILALAAQGPDPPLDLDRERRNLEKACGSLEATKLEWIEPPTLEQLRRRLLEKEFHVLHVMGHGRFDRASGEGLLFFEQTGSGPHEVSARLLAETLSGFPSLRLVVLNACQTALADTRLEGQPFEGIASGLMLGGLPAAVAMQAPLDDTAAIAFSKTFYQRLTAGAPVEAALTEGRLAIRQLGGGGFEWAIPALFLRARTGMLFISPSRRRLVVVVLLGLLLATAALAWKLRREQESASKLRRERELSTLVNEAAPLVLQGYDLEKARENLGEALRLAPDHAPSHALLADLEALDGHSSKALYHLEIAIQRQPAHARHRYRLGYVLNNLGRHEEARTSLLRALELDPAYAEAINELGNTEQALGRLPEARWAYGEALQLAQARKADERELAPIWKNLGRAAIEAAEPGAAIEPLENALAGYVPQNAQDHQGNAEACFLLATAHAALGHREAACNAVRRYRHADEQGLLEWSDDLEELAEELGCDAATAVAQGAGQPSETDAKPLAAVVTKVSGAVVVVTASSTVEDVHRAQPLQGVPAGAEIVLPEDAELALVCSTNHHVELRKAQRWNLTVEACAAGRLLQAGTYRRLIPRGGRLVMVDGIYVLEPPTRPIIELDPLAPVLLAPRNTRLREARPRLEWTRVPSAYEYEIEISGLGMERVREADGGCRPDSAWAEGFEVCSTPFPASFHDLEPGRVYFLSVGARSGVVSPLRTEREKAKLERWSAAESAQLETDLAAVAALDLPPAAAARMRGTLLTEKRLYAEAIEVYRHLLATEKSGEVLVTLGDLYLAIGLDGLAERSYTAALEKHGTEIEAAATLGLGLVQAARKHFEQARECFQRAAELYARAGLEQELAVATRLMTEARDKASSFTAPPTHPHPR